MIFALIAVLMACVAAAVVAVPLWRGVPTEEGNRRSPTLAITASAVIFAAAGLLYWNYGNWRVGAEGVEAASVPAVEQMVSELAKRLHGADAKDLQGWEMLGHAYIIMERYPDAVDAYAHARQLAGDGDADVLAGYAQALTLASADEHPEVFMQQALPLFERVLTLDPHNPQALWYGGLGALQRGDKALAVSCWQTLLAQDPPEEYRAVISKYITDAGGDPTARPGAATLRAAAQDVRVHVSLSPAFLAQVTPGETLFLFAEAPGAAGGPPLAARRFQVSDLPLDVSLDDQDAVIPGRRLSAYAELEVTARISVAGTPTAQRGDLMGQGEWKRAGGKALAIVIDTTVK